MSSIEHLRLNNFFKSLKAEDFINNEKKNQNKKYDYFTNNVFNNPLKENNNILEKNNNNSLRNKPLKKIKEKFNTSPNIGEVVNTSKIFMLKEINFALILIAAFAWHDAIKYYIAKSIKFNKGSSHYYILYAIIISVLTVIIITFTNMFLDEKDRQELNPVHHRISF